MSKNIAVSSTYLTIQESKNLIKLSFKQFRALGGPGKYTPLCLWGHAGIGKTAMVNQAAEEVAKELESEFGRPVRILVQNFQLSCMQPFDLGGYPFTEVTKLRSGTTITLQNFATPRWMVEGELEDYDFVFAFLDEINRARPEMHNTIMGVLDGRGVNGHKLRTNYFVLAAANPVTDDSAYGAVTEIADQAILDRMCHLNVIPSQEEYLQFLKNKHDKNDSMYNFLISERDGFGGNKEKSMWPKNDFVSITIDENKITNTNRGGDVVESAMPFLGHVEKLREAFSKGILGDIVGQKFSDTYNKNVILIKPEEIIEKPTKTTYEVLAELVNKDGTGTSRHDEVSKINDTVLGYLGRTGRKELNKKQIGNLKKYLEEIPHDFKELIVTKANFIGEEKKEFSPMRQAILKASKAEGTVLGELEFR